MSTILRMCNITKRFPGVLANDCVNLEVERGEIHALLGENGAGKSTLMNCLYGLYQPQAGEIYLNDQRVEVTCTGDAVALGIGMIHQHFMLVPQLTVLENIIASLRSDKGVFIDKRRVRQQVMELAQKHQLQIEPDAYVWQISVGAQQRVEIIKVLLTGAQILVLDEPTAVLTPQEVRELFHILRSLAGAGKTIIFISHKLDEVTEISDRVTVLRNGRVVGTVKTKATNKAELARMMVGREVLFTLEKEAVQPGETVLEVEHIHAFNDRKLPAVKDVSFVVRRGEILGIAGVDGNGQNELTEVIAGLRKATRGRVLILGRDVTNRSPHHVLFQGVAHIPAERKAVGTIGEFSVAENLVLVSYDTPPFARLGWLNQNAIDRFARERIQEFDVRTPGPGTFAEQLSGGNLQKVVLARELARRHDLLLCVQPTRGLDVGAIEYVHRRLLEERRRGAGILLVSTELDEILGLSDRIAVMYEGQIMGIIPNQNVELDQLGLMMAGALRLTPQPAA
jgi:ABC-type uncharacterized transport system ATPase subunit